jgi:putative spermidine/putrescine transport system ATP-binding protein/putrescine transport system ATP-binding protein
MLLIDAVTKRFDSHQAVAGASLELARGETLALLGPSGCGKTTLLRLLAGFERPDTGRILLDGSDIAAVPPSRRNFGLVFQDYALFPNMTVAGNIEYGLRRRGMKRAERALRLAEMLALVRLEGLGARLPTALSGGQQQRVALARALAIRPPLLLLDEPLSNLDAKLRVELADELRATLVAANTTTLIVTHDQAEAMTLGDRIAIMAEGRILQTGTAETLYRTPATRFVAEFLGRCNWLLGAADPHDPSQFRWQNEAPLRLAAPLLAHADCAIRPEAVRILPDQEAGGPNARTASVRQVTFLGQETLVRLRLPGGTDLLASVPPRDMAPCAAGADVRLDIAPPDIQAIARTG